MGKGYLIDTNVLIDAQSKKLSEFATKRLAEIINEQFAVSVITYIEFLGYKYATSAMKDFIGLADVITLDKKVINETINIRQNNKIKLPDALIAATAIAHDYVLITRNIKDFNSIPNLLIEDIYIIN